MMKRNDDFPSSRQGGRKTSCSNYDVFRGKKMATNLTPPRYNGINTGVAEKDKQKKGLSFKVDWLSFTVPMTLDQKSDNRFWILSRLGYDLENFEEVNGINFYNSGYSYGGYVKIYFNDPQKPLQKGTHMTVNYIFTGVGCTDLGERIESRWLELFNWLKEVGVSFRRIDIALDDFNSPPLVDFPKLEYKLDNREFISSKRRYNFVKDVATNGEIQGETCYFGKRSRSSTGSTMLRVYQKYLQMVYAKNEAGQMPIPALMSQSWIRWEIEFSKEKAVAMIDLMLEKGAVADAYYGVLADIITFVKPTKGKNGKVLADKHKWEVSDWWQTFINEAKKAKLQDPKKTYDIESALSWVKFSVMPTLQMLEAIYKDRGIDFYSFLPYVKSTEYSKKQKRLMAQAKTMSKKELLFYLSHFIEADNYE